MSSLDNNSQINYACGGMIEPKVRESVQLVSIEYTVRLQYACGYETENVMTSKSLSDNDIVTASPREIWCCFSAASASDGYLQEEYSIGHRT